MKPVERVVIVDDYLEDRFFLSHHLREVLGDIRIDEFGYGDDALEQLSGVDVTSFDLMFVDINMQPVDGFDFLESFLAALPTDRTPGRIFLVSGTFSQSDIERAESYGSVSALMQKPVTKEKLQEVLAS